MKKIVSESLLAICTEHLHSGIDYVTPEQCHRGLREKIASERKSNLKKQHLLRKEVNRLHQSVLTNDPITLIVNPNILSVYSVTNPLIKTLFQKQLGICFFKYGSSNQNH